MKKFLSVIIFVFISGVLSAQTIDSAPKEKNGKNTQQRDNLEKVSVSVDTDLTLQIEDYSNAVVFVSENQFENEDAQYKEDKAEEESVNKRFETPEPKSLIDDSNTDLNDEGYDLSDER